MPDFPAKGCRDPDLIDDEDNGGGLGSDRAMEKSLLRVTMSKGFCKKPLAVPRSVTGTCLSTIKASRSKGKACGYAQA